MAASTVDACTVCVLFSNCVNWVHALVLIAGGALAACVHNIVLCAGAVVWKLVFCFLVRCLCFFLVWHTLVTHGADNWGTWGFGGVMDMVYRVLLLVYIGTLKLTGAAVVYVGAFELAVLCCNARSVIWISCHISSPPLLLPKFFIALAQSAISAITLSECAMLVQVSFLWLKCMVSVKRSLLVDFMWHICVR